MVFLGLVLCPVIHFTNYATLNLQVSEDHSFIQLKMVAIIIMVFLYGVFKVNTSVCFRHLYVTF